MDMRPNDDIMTHMKPHVSLTCDLPLVKIGSDDVNEKHNATTQLISSPERAQGQAETSPLGKLGSASYDVLGS